MAKIFTLTSLITLLILNFSCGVKSSKSDIDVQFTQDTLKVGYTYWWPQSGPFINLCGSAHSLVFTGTIAKMATPNDDSGPLYTAQEGSIAIERVYKIKDLGEKVYAAQKFISTDCFFESGLNEGDTVLVFCYDYEEDYTIPGKESIIKIDGFEDPLIKSIRNYIDNDDDPTVLKNDMGLWATHGHGRALEASIECWEELNSTTGTQE